jgi:hypothetical protein
MSKFSFNFNLGFLRSQRKIYSILLLIACIVISLILSNTSVVQNIARESFVGKKKATSFIDEIISDNATDKGIRIAAIKSVTTIMDKKDAKPLLEILEDSSKSDDDKIKDIQKYIETMS